MCLCDILVIGDLEGFGLALQLPDQNQIIRHPEYILLFLFFLLRFFRCVKVDILEPGYLVLTELLGIHYHLDTLGDLLNKTNIALGVALFLIVPSHRTENQKHFACQSVEERYILPDLVDQLDQASYQLIASKGVRDDLDSQLRVL